MPAPPDDSRNLQFDVFTLDLRAGELYKSGHKIRLQEQPFRILAMLLERPGQVVTREQLRERLWPEDTFVDFDHSLNTAVKKLRQALNDEADKPRFVETLPKRGYRFVGPAVEGWQAQQSPSGKETGSSGDGKSGEFAAKPTSSAPVMPLPVTRWKIAAPMVIFVVAIGVGAYFFTHKNRALTEKDTIVIADFSNSTGDPVFDDTLKQGLAVQLAQSPFLAILSDEKVHNTLKLMGHAPGDRLTLEIARDLCQRAGSAAVIDGSIAKLESAYIVGLNAVECRSGENLAREQITSEDKRHVLAALGTAAQELRGKLGESLSSIQNYQTPIEQATTSSLEALKAFSLAMKTSHESGEVKSIPYFERAIELDPNFALAHARLGAVYVGLGEPSHAAENIQKAYELREHVSDLERFNITALYHTAITGDLEKANQTCDLWARAYPRDETPHLIMGLDYEYLGRYEQAISEDVKTIQLNPDYAVSYSNLMEVYTPLNRLEEAKATYRRALERKLDDPFLHADMYVVAFLENDAAEMQRQIDFAASVPGAEDWLFSQQSDTAAYSGQLAKARDFSRQAVESAQHNDLNEVAAIWRMNASLREVEFGNANRARKEVEEGLKLADTRDSEIIAALILARSGDPTRAQALADRLEKRFPQNTELNSYWLPSVRAAIQLDRGKPLEALKTLEVTLPYELGYPRPELEGGSLVYPAYLRGQAYLLLHRGSEAATEFQKFIDLRVLVVNCPFGALAHLWLGRAHAVEGNAATARASYQRFFTLWKDADPDIPIVRAAKIEFAKLN
ncbi:MAG TPA: winged helix-turn-helix domain-containing protein [Candidatus Limnocylindria bacterium]|nr:winged helix-turn-helix domain-containing protein [Candidatus Limnocylindria bacterium]